MTVVLIDKAGKKIADIETADGPFSFQLQTVSGLREYTLSFVFKRDSEGNKDPEKVKGAMLQ